MATMNVKDAAGATVAVEKPLVPGQAAMAASRPVVLASDQSSIPVASTLAAETTKVIGTVRVASGGVAAGSLATGSAVDGWDLTQGAIADAASATGSISAKLRAIATALGVTAFDLGSGTGGSRTLRTFIDPGSQNANGSTTDANSTPTAWSTEGKAQLGAVAETAPASDTASSGLNGRLQRIAQNITTLIAATLKVALQAATSGGLSRSRTLIPNNTTAIVVKSGAGQLYKVRATNNSATIAYIKIYDATSATAGSGTPVDTIMIPSSASGTGIVDTTDVGAVHATGITYVVTTGIADADTAAPAANAYIVTFFYK